MDREMRDTLRYFCYGCLMGLGLLLVAGVFLFGCGDNEHGTTDWACADCPDLPPRPWGSSVDAPSAPDARPLQADAAPTTAPDAPETAPDAPGGEIDAAPEADAPTPPACDDATCDPTYAYCANGECLPWPPIPPPSTWDCGGDSDGIGCCVSVCQKECDLNLPNSLWSACSNSCELRCKELLQ